MLTFLGRMFAITLTVIALHHLPWNFFMNQWLAPAEAATPPVVTGLTEGVQKTVLANGLTVLIKEVHTSPVVTVQVWYPVGSRNEHPGITGISHQLEHLMFKGTHQRPIQFGRLFSALGSESNAFTSYDMTAYYGVVGKDKLEALLELEADRMVNTLATKEALQSERSVVLSELDGNNNNPGTRLYRAVMGAGFAHSAYGWPVIGYRQDVENYKIAQVQQHYRTFYRPDKATLVIVGDCDRQKTLAKVQALFGKLTVPPQTEPEEYRSEQQGTGSKNPIVMREPGSNPFLQILFPTLPAIGHPDVAALDVLDTILTSGKSARLFQALVQSGMANSVSGSASTMKTAGWYLFSATPAQGIALATLHKAILQEITRLQEQGITAEELKRGKEQLRAGYILNNRSIKGQALQLGYNQIVAGDYRYSDRYLQELQGTTQEAVQRVAKTYFQRSVVGYFEPTSGVSSGVVAAPQAPQHASYVPSAPVNPREVRQYLPRSAFETPGLTKPAVLADRFTLGNGMTVLLLPDRSSPTVTLAGDIQAGTGFDSDERAGLASLVAQNLRNGTTTADSLSLATALEKRGASLSFSTHREGVGISGIALKEDLPIVLRQLADVVQRATFPETELELSRQRNLVNLRSELDNPGSVARRSFQQTLYPPGHPFHPMRTAASLNAITRQEVLRFYQQFYRPETTTLTLVGDFDPLAVKSLIKDLFAQWKSPGTIPQLSYPKVDLPAGVMRQEVVLSGKTQAVTILGHPSIARTDRRYYAAQLLNQVLGGDTLSSRLGTEIRDRRGLTYGIYSVFQAGRQEGPFLIQLQTNPQDVTQAVESTLALLRQVRTEGITAAELESAKNSLTNNFPVDLADPGALARIILADQLYGMPVGDFYQFPQRLGAVTLEEVNTVARTLLHPDRLLIVTVTPPKAGQ